MEVFNRLQPNDQQITGFADPDDSLPIYMVNLLKYRDAAKYADGRSSALTGREAYALYAEGVNACLAAVGGKVEFAGTVRRLVLGDVEELWDDIATVMYPSRHAMLEMAMSSEYAKISEHRDAGLAGQLNIETISSEFAR